MVFQTNIISIESPPSIVSSIFDSIPDKKSEDTKATEKKEDKEEEESSDPSKMKITRVFDFAGENVK